MKGNILIENLRNTDAYISTIFLNGGCWKFYKFLKSLYPQSIPYKVGEQGGHFDHIITKIGTRYYDITGMVKPIDYPECEEVKEEEFPEFEKWGFAKNNLLYKRCPHCGEEILIDTKGSITI